MGQYAYSEWQYEIRLVAPTHSGYEYIGQQHRKRVFIRLATHTKYPLAAYGLYPPLYNNHLFTVGMQTFYGPMCPSPHIALEELR